MTFGENLQNLLEERDISQKDFASMLNIAKTTLNGYIKSNHERDFKTVMAMADALHVSTDCLLGYTSTSAPTSKELLFLERLRQLPPEQRNIVYDLVMVIERRAGKNKNG